MARDLYDRLKRLKEQSGSQKRETPLQGARVSAIGLNDWEQVAPGVLTLETIHELPPDFVPSAYSRLLNRPVEPSGLCFLDTETTGLSGGAGTAVFLIGTGRITGSCFTVRQTLMLDFPFEPDFLAQVRPELFDGGVWVSYNGKAFDARLIATRFLMNGSQVTLPEQLDLLFWARRLWRRLIGPCSLEDIEQRVLGIDRGPDIPGFEIPERYFRFLRFGDGKLLQEVFRHHQSDIVSLMRLYLCLETILERTEENGSSVVHGAAQKQSPCPAMIGFDRLALGRYLLVRNRGGEELLRQIVEFPKEDEAGDVQELAGLLLAARYRRRGELARAAELWEKIWSNGSIAAGVELAKHLEHRARDLETAQHVVMRLLETVDSPREREALEYRLNRLERKRRS